LIQLGRIEHGLSINHKCRHLPGVIRNFEVTVVSTQQECQSTVVVNEVREISETLVLIGVVMNWVATPCRIFDADATVEIASEYVVGEVSGYSAVLHARCAG